MAYPTDDLDVGYDGDDYSDKHPMAREEQGIPHTVYFIIQEHSSNWDFTRKSNAQVLTAIRFIHTVLQDPTCCPDILCHFYHLGYISRSCTGSKSQDVVGYEHLYSSSLAFLII